MRELKRVFAYFSNLWGLLTLAVIALPASTYLKGVKLYPENSLIHELYGAVPSIAAAFFLLLLTTFKKELTAIAKARKWAITSGILAFISIFVFIGIKTIYLDLDSERQVVNPSTGGERLVARSKGIIMVKEVDLRSPNGDSVFKQESGDPWDIASLLFLTFSISGFTCCFGILGIHGYMNSAEQDVPPKSDRAGG